MKAAQRGPELTRFFLRGVRDLFGLRISTDKEPYEDLNLEWPSYVFQPGPRIRNPSSLTPNFDPTFASSSWKIFRKKQKKDRNTRCVRPFRKDKAITFFPNCSLEETALRTEFIHFCDVFRPHLALRTSHFLYGCT